MSHLEVSSLRFTRGSFSVSVSFALRKGQTGVILGPSGCGKTTLLRCVAGLERQDEGTISINGKEISSMPPERRGLGFIFQDLALFDHLSGRQNIAFGMKLRGFSAAHIDARIGLLAKTLKIEGLLARRPFAMSGGERQRLAFARAVAPDPELLLMDEPLSSLDAPLRRELRAYLRSSLKAEGITALHVTHDVEEALELGDTLFLMKNGRIIAAGTPEDIWENPPDAWCVRFLALGALLSPGFARGMSLRPTPTSGDAAKTFRLFVPRGCATLCHPEDRGARREKTGAFPAEVTDVIFLGDHRRVQVRLREDHATPSPPSSAQENPESESLAIDVDRALPIAKGESVSVRIDFSRCGLLPTE